MKDMTKGSPIRLILGFAIPLFFGMLFQQFYNLVDMIIVGRFLGASALAAVGATGSINFMIIGFCMGVCNGFAIPVAQKFGAKDEKQLRYYVANSVWLSIIFAVVMTVTVSLLCRDILVWMDTPEDIFDASYAYIIVIFIGIPVTYLYNLLSGIMRSLGDSKSPLIFLVISSVLNIAFDIIAIAGMHLGVAGAAGATVLAQAISGVCCLIYLIKKFPILRVHGEEWRWRGHFVARLCGMGIPMGLQYSITAIGSVILQTAVNGLGSTAVASVTAAGKISMFCCCPFDALAMAGDLTIYGSTMATYAGQNVGAKKMDRVNTGILTSSIIGSVYSVVILGVMFLWSRQISLLFVDASETVILDQARQMLLINMVFYIPLTLVNVVRFTVQGMGFSKFAILAGVCEMIGRSVVAFFLVPYFGYTAVCFASPVAWILADLFLVPAYLYCAKTLRSLFEKNAQMM